MNFELAEGRAGIGGSLEFSALPPFLRVLLLTDGTVTTSLAAYFDERIDVEVLLHEDLRADRNHPEIEVVPGDPIVQRCVILRGAPSGTAYAFAETTMAIDHLAEDVKRGLAEGRKGIGEVLREGRLETYREIFVMRRSEAGERAIHLGVDRNADVLIRSYKIYHLGRAAIQIEEVFPMARFQSAAS